MLALARSPDLPRTRGAEARKRFKRLYFRNKPVLYLAVPGLAVLVVALLDIVHTGVRKDLEDLASSHHVLEGLATHLVVTAFLAGLAYYLLFGRRLRAALRAYRKVPAEELVEWADGRPAIVRKSRASLFAEGIARSLNPAVGIVYGRTGTGRTSFLVALVEELASRKLVPVPVRARRDGSLILEKDAEAVFRKQIDTEVSSEDQGDSIWRRTRKSGSVVVIVDCIDDDIVAGFWDDDGARLQRTVKELVAHDLAMVLATTRRLPLDGMVTIREDLDRFTRAEAGKYVHIIQEQGHIDQAKADEAIAALSRLHDPLDESLVAPFYLELIAGLREPLGELPRNRDLWRAGVLERYLKALPAGGVAQPRRPNEHDAGELRRRGGEAVRAARAVAKALKVQDGELAVDMGTLESAGHQEVKQAVDFGLLWNSEKKRVGFTADDLLAYVIGTTADDPSRLLEAVTQIAEREQDHGREDRYPLMALIFWAHSHPGNGRTRVFKPLVDAIDHNEWNRPAVVAAAIRIATICEIDEDDDVRVLQDCAERSIAHVEKILPDDPRAWRRQELTKLVRALADWPRPEAHLVLWRLAGSTATGLDWPAAKALAMASGKPEESLRQVIRERVGLASKEGAPALSPQQNPLGNEIGALAWVLPAVRDRAAAPFSVVKRLCIAGGMSPLRGEVALAQGLKHAVLNERCVETNLKDVVDLLAKRTKDRDPFVRSWHARVILVQTLLADVWIKGGANSDAYDGLLRDLEAREEHELVLRALKLVRDGMKAVRRQEAEDKLDRYIWVHEKDVVSWVGQGKKELAQLAADVVLLSNMSYELREHHLEAADHAAKRPDLPLCIRNSSQRHQINEGGVCTCGHQLCSDPKDPVRERHAPFEESFCRQQVRLARRPGPPAWVSGTPLNRQALEQFWEAQASKIARDRRPE